MDKSNQKKQRHNSLAVKVTAEKFGYTARYIRGCLTGEFVGIMPDEVKKAYKEAKNKIDSTVENLKTI
ncbi:hypothetical protein JSO59_001155 [Riemerella anatipestifer]|uniref:hypothetical protein n=1 Tax=Riemerella anatipestifer TaxID=34085 RepID=UPI0030BC8EA1